MQHYFVPMRNDPKFSKIRNALLMRQNLKKDVTARYMLVKTVSGNSVFPNRNRTTHEL